MDLPAHCPDIACVADGGLNGGLVSNVNINGVVRLLARKA